MTFNGPLTPQPPCSPIAQESPFHHSPFGVPPLAGSICFPIPQERPFHRARISAPPFALHFLNWVGVGRVRPPVAAFGRKWNKTERFRSKMERLLVPPLLSELHHNRDPHLSSISNPEPSDLTAALRLPDGSRPKKINVYASPNGLTRSAGGAPDLGLVASRGVSLPNLAIFNLQFASNNFRFAT